MEESKELKYTHAQLVAAYVAWIEAAAADPDSYEGYTRPDDPKEDATNLVDYLLSFVPAT